MRHVTVCNRVPEPPGRCLPRPCPEALDSRAASALAPQYAGRAGVQGGRRAPLLACVGWPCPVRSLAEWAKAPGALRAAATLAGCGCGSVGSTSGPLGPAALAARSGVDAADPTAAAQAGTLAGVPKQIERSACKTGTGRGATGAPQAALPLGARLGGGAAWRSPGGSKGGQGPPCLLASVPPGVVRAGGPRLSSWGAAGDPARGDGRAGARTAAGPIWRSLRQSARQRRRVARRPPRPGRAKKTFARRARAVSKSCALRPAALRRAPCPLGQGSERGGAAGRGGHGRPQVLSARTPAAGGRGVSGGRFAPPVWFSRCMQPP